MLPMFPPAMGVLPPRGMMMEPGNAGASMIGLCGCTLDDLLQVCGVHIDCHMCHSCVPLMCATAGNKPGPRRPSAWVRAPAPVDPEAEKKAQELKLKRLQQLKALTDEQNKVNAELRQRQAVEMNQHEVGLLTGCFMPCCLTCVVQRLGKTLEAEELQRRIMEQEQMIRNLQRLQAHKAKKAKVLEQSSECTHAVHFTRRAA